MSTLYEGDARLTILRRFISQFPANQAYGELWLDPNKSFLGVLLSLS